MPDKLIAIRSSSAPAATVCPGSIRGGEMKIRKHYDEAPLGSAAHEMLAAHVLGNELSAADVAARWGIPDSADEVARLTRYGQKAWRELAATFGPAQTEVEGRAFLVKPPGDDDPRWATGLYDAFDMAGIGLTGHLDGLRVVPELRWAALFDWKTGRLDANYLPQVMAYAFLVFENHSDVDNIDAAIIWLRDQTVERYQITRAQAMDWRDRFVVRVVNWDGRYYTGEHCGHCERSHDCPALIASARRDVAILGEPALVEQMEKGLQGLDDLQISALLRKSSGLSKFLDTFGDVARAEIRRRGGAIDAGANQEYRFLVTEPREVNTLVAWPVLQARMSDEELAGVCKVSISKAADVVKGNAGKGKGAAAIRELDAALEEAGAVSRRHQESLRLVRK